MKKRKDGRSPSCTGCGATTDKPKLCKNGEFCPTCIATPSHAFLEKPKK